MIKIISEYSNFEKQKMNTSILRERFTHKRRKTNNQSEHDDFRTKCINFSEKFDSELLLQILNY